MGICPWIQVRRRVQLLVEFQWAEEALSPSPLADRAAQGDTRGGCRSVVDIWAVPWEDTAAAVCTGGSPHDPEGRGSNGLNKADQALELMEEAAQSETWFEGSKLLNLGKKKTNEIQKVITTIVHKRRLIQILQFTSITITGINSFTFIVCHRCLIGVSTQE